MFGKKQADNVKSFDDQVTDIAGSDAETEEKTVDTAPRAMTPAKPNLLAPKMASSSPSLSQLTRMASFSQPSAASVATDRPEPRKLIVGKDIKLTGEINSCDYLVVEGDVQAQVNDGDKIEITEAGFLQGTADIVEADIAGRFEGEMYVKGLLRLRATGVIKGRIEYGELEVEAGGRLEGEIICNRDAADEESASYDNALAMEAAE